MFKSVECVCVFMGILIGSFKYAICPELEDFCVYK